MQAALRMQITPGRSCYCCALVPLVADGRSQRPYQLLVVVPIMRGSVVKNGSSACVLGPDIVDVINPTEVCRWPRRRVWQYAIRAVVQGLALPRPRWLSFPDMLARLRQRRAYERLHLQRLQAQKEGADGAEVPGVSKSPLNLQMCGSVCTCYRVAWSLA